MKNSKFYRDQARSLLESCKKEYALVTLIYFAISLANSYILPEFLAFSEILSQLVPLVISSIFIAGPFALAEAKISLKAVKGKKFDVSEIFSGYEKFTGSLFLYLRVSIITFLWALLFIIPGILASFAYSMAFYVYAENPNFTAKQAMEESDKLMDGHRWELFKLEMSFIGWILLSLLTCGILFLWTTPYMQTATAVFYSDLKYKKYGTVNPYSNEDDEYLNENTDSYYNANEYNQPSGYNAYNIDSQQHTEPYQAPIEQNGFADSQPYSTESEQSDNQF